MVVLTSACRFFFHEHARKIGIWAWAFVISPYLGPFLSAIISNFKPWRTSFWIDFLIVGLALTFVTFLGDETLYDRDNTDIQTPKPQGFLVPPHPPRNSKFQISKWGAFTVELQGADVDGDLSGEM